MILPIGDVVAFAAPGVEEPGPLPSLPVEQPGRHGKGFGATGDAVARMGDEGGTIEMGHAADMPRDDDCRKGGGYYSLSAFIAKIGSCAS